MKSFFVGFLMGMVVLRQMPLALEPYTVQETGVNNQPTNSSASAVAMDTNPRIPTEDVQDKDVARFLDTQPQPQSTEKQPIEQPAIETDHENPVQQQQQVDQQQQQQNEVTAVDMGDEIPAVSWESQNQPDSTLPPTASVFPQFIQDYIKFHNQNRGHPAAKYLIWRCPPNGQCGGTGDRIKGILSALYTAICTNRVLLIDWPVAGGGDVSQFLQPHTIDWTIPNSIKAYMQTLVKYSAIDSYAHPAFQQLQIPARMADFPMIDMRSNLWSEHVKAVVSVNDTQCVQEQLWTKETVPNPFAPQQKVLFRMGFWALFTFADQVHERKLNMQMRTGLLLEQQLKRQQEQEAMQQQPTRRRRLQQDPLQLKINQAVRTHYAKETARKQKAMIQHQLAEQQKRKSQLQRLQKETAMAGKTTLQPYI
ncbi:expressed unknown protein (Partial), partial [Seminavis robusta]|eukprot:Sro2754_g336290.1 n/a (421) ;mRNA; f:10571-11834